MVQINKQILTKNDCYKSGRKINVKGLMLHSTGANNPKLSRYISPDDGNLGTPSSNHWNQPKPGGRQVCVHGFIGKDKNGNVRTYQTLPWNHRGWGGGGSSNNTHIHVEICEDDLKDKKYFNAVYKEAVELFAYLCKKFNLDENDIITHSEGYKKGIASNHADVMHWFPRHGKSMDTFRKDVKAKLNGNTTVTKTQPAPTEKVKAQSVTNTKANLKVDGKWGPSTTKALQIALGTVADGVLSKQLRNSVTNVLYGGVTFSTGGSLVIKALQKKLGAKVDGYLGPETIRLLQVYLGTVVDGKLSKPSLVVKELQRRLNIGTF